MAENQDNRSGSNGSRRQNPADNLSHADRVRGGERSSKMQRRDEQGQFAGRRSGDANPQGQSNESSIRSNRSGSEGGSTGEMGSRDGGMQA
jgi:hypothetical protein